MMFHIVVSESRLTYHNKLVAWWRQHDPEATYLLFYGDRLTAVDSWELRWWPTMGLTG